MDISIAVIQESIQTICRLYDTSDVVEVDFVPSSEPPYVLFDERCLGISMKILKPLYKYSYQRLMTLNERLKTATRSGQLEKLKDIIVEGMTISEVALTVKGDIPVAYHLRKQGIMKSKNLITKELSFLSAIFTKHPKCPSGWDHRRWCLKQHMDRHERTSLLASEIETEKELCRVLAEKYPRNYYAWMHRLWLVKFMVDIQLEDEMHFTYDWILSHVSDHSAIQHRMNIIQCISQRRPWLITSIIGNKIMIAPAAAISLEYQLVFYLMNESQDLLIRRPGREALWCYRRNLLMIIIAILNKTRMRPICSYVDDSLTLSLVTRWNTMASQYESTEQSVASGYQCCDNMDNLLQIELRTVLTIISQQILWDEAKQLLYSAKYCIFLIDQLLQVRTNFVVISENDNLCKLLSAAKKVLQNNNHSIPPVIENYMERIMN